MKIELKEVGKRYQDHWIFKSFSYHFQPSERYALLGANGSGKSTLLRIIAGIQSYSTGKVSYTNDGKEMNAEKLFYSISYCAPGMDIIEEMSLKEFLKFHFSFKPFLKNLSVDSILAILDMEKEKNKFIHEFSSGMKQRVKLAQAFFSDTPLLFLDEPCSNLDLQGVQLYREWLQKFTENRIVIIASNDEREYPNTKHLIRLADYKTNLE